MTPERIARLRQVLDHRQPDLAVVTDFVHKQRNLSAIVRCCDAVGVMRVDAVIGDEEYQACRGTAMGSHNGVEVNRHRELAGALAPLRREGFQVVAAHLSYSLSFLLSICLLFIYPPVLRYLSLFIYYHMHTQ